ncbi:MAG: response regulator transcription factor [Candidatus Humimicrobiaceae bacterium]
MKKILIVDDEEEIRCLIKDFLVKDNFEADQASNGKEALDKLLEKDNMFDLVILDIMMPGLDGLEVIKIIRKTSNIPVIFLTSKNEEIDKVLGLEIGADDYITKPFNPREMVARIKAVLRRTEIQEGNRSLNLNETARASKLENKVNPGGKDFFDFRNQDTNVKRGKIYKILFNSSSALGKKKVSCLEINLESYRVFINSKEAKFTNKQFQLLLYLIENKNIAISRERILEAVWGYDFSGETRTIDVHIKELRKRIGDFNGELIETIWAIGYRFNYDKELT